MEADEADRLPDEEVIGQVKYVKPSLCGSPLTQKTFLSTLTFAATDSTSSALSRILHVLCEHQDIQSKLRHEIWEAQKQHGERLLYDVISQLPLLDAVCKETLRLYPPISAVVRE